MMRLAAPDCALFLWASSPLLPQAFAVIEAWGFAYRTLAFCWAKTGRARAGFVAGKGYWTRAGAELCLLATRGAPVRLAADVDQLIAAPRGRHSEKPPQTHARIERLVAGPYLELFARRPRPGWDAWGDEADAFMESEA
ncbi:MAG: MT-A70 family methyltransferase [Kiloniellaceae bacterium]